MGARMFHPHSTKRLIRQARRHAEVFRLCWALQDGERRVKLLTFDQPFERAQQAFSANVRHQ